MNLRTLLIKEAARQLRLAELLYEKPEGCAESRLLRLLGCSRPSLKKDAERLTQLLSPMTVHKEQNSYRLQRPQHVGLDAIYQAFLESEIEFQVLLQLLLEEAPHLTALAKKLSLSRSHLQRLVQKIARTLQPLGIEIVYQPLRLVGDEVLIRHFFYLFALQAHIPFDSLWPYEKSRQQVLLLTEEILQQQDLAVNQLLCSRMKYTALISLQRQRSGHFLKAGRPLALSRAHCVRLQALLKAELADGAFTFIPEDCFWLQSLDYLVITPQHLRQALQDNPDYRTDYNRHRQLTEKLAVLTRQQLSEQQKEELAQHLVNYFRPLKDRVLPNILQDSGKLFVSRFELLYQKALQVLSELLREFLLPAQLADDELLHSYLAQIITTLPNLLAQIASDTPRLRLLIVSDLSYQNECFLGRMIKENLPGNYSIHHYHEFPKQEAAAALTFEHFDLVLTTMTLDQTSSSTPLFYLDSCPNIATILALGQRLESLQQQKTTTFAAGFSHNIYREERIILPLAAENDASDSYH